MWQGFSTPVDLYCERTGPGLWSEPVNALTNLVIIAAGLWGLRQARRHDAGIAVVVLCWWVVAIGIGSAIFHLFATRGTIWFDVLPIAGFVLAYTLFSMRRYLGMAWGGAIALVVGFYAIAGLAAWSLPAWLREASNGTTSYLPPFLGLALLGGLIALKGCRAGWYVLGAFPVFLLAIVFRMIDPMVCAGFPLGTHFLWHVFDGLTLAILLAAAARHGRARTAAAQGTKKPPGEPGGFQRV
jgi:hypothetical protein